MEEYMSRPLVLSNGELHVGINKYGLVHDFYYPYVGLENHASGSSTRHRVGVWVDGNVYWLDANSWEISFDYQAEALIGLTQARHEHIGVQLEFQDAVDTNMSAFMRKIRITNLRSDARDIRLFMHQAFVIGDGRSNTDTAQYLPENGAILHYRGRRSFIVSGRRDGQPFDQYTVGLFGIEGYEGTYRDADDGELSGANVEHGRVDSTLRFQMILDGHASSEVDYWIAAGTSLREALHVHKYISEKGVSQCLTDVARFWQEWLKPAKAAAEKIDPVFHDSFLKSVLILKSQIDKRGAIMASTDTTMLNYSRDAYAYCWPRDGAYVVWPLIRMGYKEEALRFFEFMKQGLHPGGYLLHKYHADGALGSSWHPYVHGDTIGPPIQEDETAGVLFVFAEYYLQHKDESVLRTFYEPMIKPMANFLSDYIDSTTGLPMPSYDLWEEVYLTTTYTTAVTYGALLVAADLAEAMSDSKSAVRWRTVADDIAVASKKHLFSEERGAFRKGVIVRDGAIHYDNTIDTSSLFGVFMYGLFVMDSEEMTSTVSTLEATFGVSSERPGVPRYEQDAYHRKDPYGPGNWWIITSLWLAQYYSADGQPERVWAVLDWVKNHTAASGILPEQIDPRDNSFMSVAPLTWSHAEYISTLLDTI
jgi:GH15 family glucan-1,4-alpha-glucosidase